MIDLRYHIASLVGIFLALGLGILIGSTIVSDDLMVDQQRKMIDKLEEQFYLLRDRENELIEANEFANRLINNYENYSQMLLPAIVKDRLLNYKVAIVVTGGKEIPAGMLNALSTAGIEVISKTVILPNINMENVEIRKEITEYYGLNSINTVDELQGIVASTVAEIIAGNYEKSDLDLLQKNNLIKFSGTYDSELSGVIIVGGADEATLYYPQSLDNILINNLLANGIKVFGVESSNAEYSYINEFQKTNISTIDNIDLSTGQISLILAMEGETGNYGVKTSARKFMPSIPIEYLKGQ